MEGANSILDLLIEQIGLPKQFVQSHIEGWLSARNLKSEDLTLRDLRELAADLLEQLSHDVENNQLRSFNDHLN